MDIIRDIVWPFREYEEVSEFVHETQGASITIAILGIVLSRLGFSPKISTATGMIGLASSLMEIVLRAWLNKKDENITDYLKSLGIRKVPAILIEIFAGFILYVVVISSFGLSSLINFSLGLVQFFIAGALYMYSYRMVSEESVRARILIPIFVTIGFMTSMFVLLPPVIKGLGISVSVPKGTLENISNMSH